MFQKKIAVAALALASGLSLSGCTIASTSNHMNHGTIIEESSDFSNADIMFAQMMIPHHQQAVDMGTLAEARTNDPSVRALAAQIKSEQVPEIIQMKSWLSESDSNMNMGHEMGMNGMLSDAEMAELTNSSGTAFDVLYLAGMIAHHQGAISMAQTVVNSENAEVKALAEAIISSQTKQITELQNLLAAVS